jgi:hypothetical protein
MIFPARLKSHSALNVYFPIGESLLMKMMPLVESKPSLDAGLKGAYESTDLNLNGAAVWDSVAITADERIALKSIIA